MKKDMIVVYIQTDHWKAAGHCNLSDAYLTFDLWHFWLSGYSSGRAAPALQSTATAKQSCGDET